MADITLRHSWWHRFFTRMTRTPQMIPPQWVGGKLKMDWNHNYYCSICKAAWEVSCLDKYRPKS